MTRLARRLGVLDAVSVGLGSMLGAGIFVALAPAADVAGSWLVAGIAIAGAVAFCNATSSAQLAAAHPVSGGTYAYARARLGERWAFAAGWCFVAGKCISCAAIARTFARYVAPGAERPLAAAAVVALVALNLAGIERTARAMRVGVLLVFATLGVVVAAAMRAPTGAPEPIAPPDGVLGVLASAGIMFFAFAGYARIATLGEEVRDPAVTIMRAIPIALGITIITYTVVAVAALAAIGPRALAGAEAPLVEVVRAGLAAAEPVVRAGAVVATLGVLLSLLAGVSRTIFAMAADGELPRALASVHRRTRVPHRAELAVGAVVVAIAITAEPHIAIGASSFAVLLYYAITGAAALRLSRAERRWPRSLAYGGIAGCVLLAATLPRIAVAAGAAALALGLAARTIGRALSRG